MPKGVYKKTEAYKKKLSEAKKGKSYEEFYGEERAIEEREKRRLAHLGKKYPVEEYPNKGMRNKKWGHHSQESRIKISVFQQGILPEEWKGFKLSTNRFLKNTAKYQIWRNFVFLRDNFICQNSNCEFCHNKIGVYLQAHHIKPLSLFPELAFRVDNGITYCKEFHLKSNLHKNIKIKINGGGEENLQIFNEQKVRQVAFCDRQPKVEEHKTSGKGVGNDKQPHVHSDGPVMQGRNSRQDKARQRV